MTPIQTSVAPIEEAIEALVDHARDLRIRAHKLRDDVTVPASDRIVGYEVAAALNEVAAALLRCA